MPFGTAVVLRMYETYCTEQNWVAEHSLQTASGIVLLPFVSDHMVFYLPLCNSVFCSAYKHHDDTPSWGKKNLTQLLIITEIILTVALHG